MPSRNCVAALAFALAFAAQAHPAATVPEVAPAPSTPAIAPTPPDHPAPAPATIVFYRMPGFVGSLVGHVVMVNGERAVKLRPKQMATLSVPAGTTEVCIFGDELCLEPFEAEPGATYYVCDSADAQRATGAHVFSIHLERVDADTAAAESAGLKAIEPLAAFR